MTLRRPSPLRFRTTLGAAALAVLALATACGERPAAVPAVPDVGRVLPVTRALAPGELYVGLAFSGGGHRASAFAAGVLEELAATGAPANRDGLAGSVRFVAGVSGGAVTAGWFALEGARGLPAFRTRYLAQHADAYLLHPSLGRPAAASATEPPVDARASLGRALDELLFSGATYAALPRTAPMLRLVASDVARAAPFVFSPATFAAFCADLARVPLSEAIAASAAFPAVFRPVEIAIDRHRCTARPAVLRALAAPAAAPVLQRLAAAQARYADPEVKDLRLWDGGVSDIFGTSAFIAARVEAADAIAPMTPREAVRVREILFLAVDASAERGPVVETLAPGARTLALTLYGLPQRLRDGGTDAVNLALTGRAIRATTRDGFETIAAALTEWQGDLVAWRCALPRARAAALYGGRLPAGWDCRDVALFAGEVTPAGLPRDLRRAVNAVPTRLHMPADEIDMVTGAGRIATRKAPAFARLIKALQAGR